MLVAHISQGIDASKRPEKKDMALSVRNRSSPGDPADATERVKERTTRERRKAIKKRIGIVTFPVAYLGIN